jgi:hypothetical protein
MPAFSDRLGTSGAFIASLSLSRARNLRQQLSTVVVIAVRFSLDS